MTRVKARKPPAPQSQNRRRSAQGGRGPASAAKGDADESDDKGDDDGRGDEGAGDDEPIEVDAEIVEGKPSRMHDAIVEQRMSYSNERALARPDPMQLYMREVQRHALLTPEEEHEIAVRYTQTGDVEAARRLVTANLRLVVKLAYEYRRAYKNMMDLIQEGNIGLMQAVKRYDPYRGVKLSSYAAWWIRAYMLRYILNNWRMVKIGTTQAQRKLFFNLSKERARLSALGIEPTHEEIAKRLNVEEKEVIEMDRRLARSDASLDSPIGQGDGRPTSRLELLPAAGRGPDAITEDAQMHDLLRSRLADFRRTLSGKDVAIFDKRLTAEEPLTLQELGNEFGVSRERVRQLEARLTGKLREYLKESLGDAVEVG
jgi:RNA polymerase sigma-32 factor